MEATFGSINTLWYQHRPAYTGSNTSRRGERVEAAAAWTLPELQDLLDQWLICGWQLRPHDSLRDPWFPKRAISPNDAYAAMVAAAGYLPVALTGEDYLELLPVTWRAINDYGIRINYRTYDVDYQTHGPDPRPVVRQPRVRNMHLETTFTPIDAVHLGRPVADQDWPDVQDGAATAARAGKL